MMQSNANLYLALSNFVLLSLGTTVASFQFACNNNRDFLYYNYSLDPYGFFAV